MLINKKIRDCENIEKNDIKYFDGKIEIIKLKNKQRKQKLILENNQESKIEIVL